MVVSFDFIMILYSVKANVSVCDFVSILFAYVLSSICDVMPQKCA